MKLVIENGKDVTAYIRPGDTVKQIADQSGLPVDSLIVILENIVEMALTETEDE